MKPQTTLILTKPCTQVMEAGLPRSAEHLAPPWLMGFKTLSRSIAALTTSTVPKKIKYVPFTHSMVFYVLIFPSVLRSLSCCAKSAPHSIKAMSLAFRRMQ